MLEKKWTIRPSISHWKRNSEIQNLEIYWDIKINVAACEYTVDTRWLGVQQSAGWSSAGVVGMNIGRRPRRMTIPRGAIAPAALVRKGKPGGRGGLMGKTNKTNSKNGMKQRFVWEKGKTGRDVQRARSGTWDIMREKKESKSEQPVRRMATSREQTRRESSGNAKWLWAVKVSGERRLI